MAVIGDKSRDSGYWGSARMILEAGLCLATQVLHVQPLLCVMTHAHAVLIRHVPCNANLAQQTTSHRRARGEIAG